MKKAILILVFISSFTGYSQCKLNKKFDKFNNTNSYNFDFRKLGSGMTDYYISKTIYLSYNENNESYLLMIMGNYGCSTKDSYVKFLFKDKTDVTFNYKGSISCGDKYLGLSLTREDILLLVSKEITDVRIEIETPNDVVLNEKQYQKLKTNLNCLLEAKY